MARVIRHDAIALHREASEEDFVRFMKEELVPYFSRAYQGPTRASRADLKSQSLRKDTRVRRKYLWITTWEGSPEAVRGSTFENARLVRFERTDAVLKKLDGLGKRSAEKTFSELISVRVPTNT